MASKEMDALLDEASSEGISPLDVVRVEVRTRINYSSAIGDRDGFTFFNQVYWWLRALEEQVDP